MARISARGSGHPIDDCGTGAARERVAHICPPNVKIDRSFLPGHGGTHIDSDGEVVLAGSFNMAHEITARWWRKGGSEATPSFWPRLVRISARAIIFAAPMAAAALEYIARNYNMTAAPNSDNHSHTNGDSHDIKPANKIPSHPYWRRRTGQAPPVGTDAFFPARRWPMCDLPGAFTPTCSDSMLTGLSPIR